MHPDTLPSKIREDVIEQGKVDMVVATYTTCAARRSADDRPLLTPK